MFYLFIVLFILLLIIIMIVFFVYYAVCLKYFGTLDKLHALQTLVVSAYNNGRKDVMFSKN